VCHVRYGQTYRVKLRFEQNLGRWAMSRIVTVVLMYHRHWHVYNCKQRNFSCNLNVDIDRQQKRQRFWRKFQENEVLYSWPIETEIHVSE
jgi:hypothetical protein